MRSLSDTIARLKKLPRAFPSAACRDTRLRRLNETFPNPGQLEGWIYVPENAPPEPPLVVVLHGCTQTAADYDGSSGWSRLADRHGFVLLYPEQQRSNNPNLCFNWFSADDAARGRGEAQSIRNMVAAVQSHDSTDPQRVFVTGLSAGGAMAAVMLATYPDVFSGGAVIAGLPFGVARSVPEAFDLMRGHNLPSADRLGDLVRSAARFSGEQPTLSVWHGSADATVDPLNASALVDQWRALHDLKAVPNRTDLVQGYPHRVWTDGNGREVIEEYVITGLGHGTPLDISGSPHVEEAGPYMLHAGISSTELIGRFWGIVRGGSTRREPQSRAAASPSGREEFNRSSQTPVQKTIEDALRSAGLLK